MNNILLEDAEATTRLGQAIAPLLAPGDSLLLYGPLGMGKSTLARGLGQARGGQEVEAKLFAVRSGHGR